MAEPKSAEELALELRKVTALEAIARSLLQPRETWAEWWNLQKARAQHSNGT